MEGHAVIQGDCVKGMTNLEAGSVDLVFADPPFNIGYDYDVYDDRKSDTAYLDWTRVLGPAGSSRPQGRPARSGWPSATTSPPS